MSVPSLLARTRAELERARAMMDSPVAVVMTMGALHAGHLELIRQAQKSAASVIVTIFVNPLQFAPHEDLDRYPRQLDADYQLCSQEKVDVVFAPSVEQMYPQGTQQVTVSSGERGAILEGVFRPGFFDGVLTVVLKLVHLTRPDLAFFGEKDYQQLLLVQQMVDDCAVPVRVCGVPIVREPDGLALSSRNVYLSPQQRQDALSLSRALFAARDMALSGGSKSRIMFAARAVLDKYPGVSCDYLEITDDRLDLSEQAPARRMVIAARVGSTRLIDNIDLCPASNNVSETNDIPVEDM